MTRDAALCNVIPLVIMYVLEVKHKMLCFSYFYFIPQRNENPYRSYVLLAKRFFPSFTQHDYTINYRHCVIIY